MVYGSKPYNTFENALVKLYPTASKTTYDKTWSSIFSKYHSLTAKEFSELTGTPRNESEKYLDDLKAKGHLEKLTTKNGAIWTLKNTSR
jgi:Fic family protein